MSLDSGTLMQRLMSHDDMTRDSGRPTAGVVCQVLGLWTQVLGQRRKQLLELCVKFWDSGHKSWAREENNSGVISHYTVGFHEPETLDGRLLELCVKFWDSGHKSWAREENNSGVISHYTVGFHEPETNNNGRHHHLLAYCFRIVWLRLNPGNGQRPYDKNMSSHMYRIVISKSGPETELIALNLRQ